MMAGQRSVPETEGEEDEACTEDPHSCRRREILRQHPEIKALMGHDHRIAYVVIALVLAQVWLCWVMREASWGAVMTLSYLLSPFLNQALGVALHEMGHNLVFGHRHAWRNRLLSIWSNLPMAVPLAITFRRYHADHHRYLGDKVSDTDVPLPFEVCFFHHPLTKLLWMVLHPIFYGIRPFLKKPKALSGWELLNLACQLVFDYGVCRLAGFKSLVYLAGGTVFGLSLHPLAAHYISEHYFLRGGHATHSYYGPANWLLFNAGYHNEHHDFPYVPYARLPLVRRAAPEFYRSLPSHSSYVRVLWDFIWDPHIAPGARGMGYPPS